jgi:hypothetical protein
VGNPYGNIQQISSGDHGGDSPSVYVSVIVLNEAIRYYSPVADLCPDSLCPEKEQHGEGRGKEDCYDQEYKQELFREDYDQEYEQDIFGEEDPEEKHPTYLRPGTAEPATAATEADETAGAASAEKPSEC